MEHCDTVSRYAATHSSRQTTQLPLTRLMQTIEDPLERGLVCMANYNKLYADRSFAKHYWLYIVVSLSTFACQSMDGDTPTSPVD